MEGNNEILFNQKTMQLAVQHYLNTVLFRDGLAPSVYHVGITGYNFRIDVTDQVKVETK